jgi:hypothetical protein
MQPDLAELIWLEYTTKAAVPSIETLGQLLPRLLSGFSDVALLVDGIDEVAAAKLIATLQACVKLAKSKECNARLFMVSRDLLAIRQVLRGATIISLQEQDSAVRYDIKAFIQAKLQLTLDDAGLSVTTTVREEVERILLQRSGGESSPIARRNMLADRRRHVFVGRARHR